MDQLADDMKTYESGIHRVISRHTRRRCVTGTWQTDDGLLASCLGASTFVVASLKELTPRSGVICTG